MSLIPRCGVCDAAISPWSNKVRCARCEEPCQTCNGDVAHCRHPLAEEALVQRELTATMQTQKRAA